MPTTKNITLAAFVTLLLISLLLESCNSENILFYLGLASYSHQISVWPLIVALAERGHNVTIFSPYRAKELHSKVVGFHPKSLVQFAVELEKLEATSMTETRREFGGILAQWLALPDMAISLCEVVLADEEVKDWMKEAKYELVVIDALLNDCGLAFTHNFDAATIYYSTSTLYPWLSEQFGLLLDSSWIPDTNYPGEQSLLQRTVATLHPLVWYFYRDWIYLPKLEASMKKTIPELADMPPIRELERNVSLLFLNAHFSEEYARSLPPFVVSVGGASCYEKSERKLLKEFDEFTKRGRDGFVYVSFGSFEDVFSDPVISTEFMNAFEKLDNLQFILRTHRDAPVGGSLPKNAMMTKWCPQKQILEHDRIRAFITHSGLLSTHEAVSNGVPMLLFPVFAEQDYNAQRTDERGLGIRLEVTNVTTDEIVNAISAFVGDKRYSENMKRASRLFKDRPEPPTETAVWWTEFVLRHRKDTSFLKPLSRNQYWFQRRLLDVWVAIFVTLTASSCLVGLIVWKTCRFLLATLLFGGGAGSSNKNGKRKIKTQ